MPVFSHSRLSSFENCPLQYRLRYVDKIEVEKRESIEAFVGRRVHDTLQHLHDRLLEGVTLSHEELLFVLRGKWEEEWHQQVHIVKSDMTQRDYWQLAERCVTNYYRSHQPFEGDKTTHTELEVRFVLDADRDIHIRGFIDRLAQTEPGRYEIHDYKTSSRLPRGDAVRKDRQLGFYQMAIEDRETHVEDVLLVWHYVAYNRRFESTRTSGDLDRLRANTLELIDQIEAATSEYHFPANRTRLCDWCEYRTVCPAWNPVQESLTLSS